jgi:4-diphosphocytidyl-2-C-methyl-D-erythritol kinase
MGGGSADAAAALRLAAAASGLTVPPGLAMALGADVPVLLEPRRALMTGAGEHVAPLPEPPPFGVVLLPVDATLPTGDVYRTFDALGLGRDPGELAELEARVRAGTAPAVNDLEPAARRLCPEIESALAALASAGADAMVSGSGPTVFGVCEDLPAAEAAAAALRQYGHPRAVAAAPVGPDFAAVRPG